MGSKLGATSSSDENDYYDWNTDDELEIFGMPAEGSSLSISSKQQHISSQNSFAESSANCMSAKCGKLIHRFVGMGFSRETVIKAIEGNGEDKEEDILETLLTLAVCLENPMQNASKITSGNCYAKKSDIPTAMSDSDKESCPGSQQNDFTFEKDEILSILVNMGYPFEQALMAIHKCGPEAQIGELADFISATQLEKEIDSLHPPPKKKLKTCMENNNIKPYSMVDRKLPNGVMGPPYFYFENVANAPKGVWNKISRFLFEIQPEFVDSKHFCAATRKRGYVHNLPIHNRSHLLPKQPLTIQEALPRTKKWWPSWDTRTSLNCLITTIAASTTTDKIRKELEIYGAAEPPIHVQQNVLKECRRWNLVWVGKNKVAPLEPDEYEKLLGFPEDHTRGGGASCGKRYKALGNAFQVDTVAYHLSVLKGRFPNGINVLSLFSGIGGAEIALHRLGIMLKNVVSVELAEVNRNIIRSWWEQTHQRGNLIEVEDVQQISLSQLRQWVTKFGGFDLIIGGSPCNNLSGKNRISRNGLEGEQSSLFYHYFRIVETVMDIQRSELL